MGRPLRIFTFHCAKWYITHWPMDHLHWCATPTSQNCHLPLIDLCHNQVMHHSLTKVSPHDVPPSLRCHRHHWCGIPTKNPWAQSFQSVNKQERKQNFKSLYLWSVQFFPAKRFAKAAVQNHSLLPDICVVSGHVCEVRWINIKNFVGGGGHVTSGHLLDPQYFGMSLLWLGIFQCMALSRGVAALAQGNKMTPDTLLSSTQVFFSIHMQFLDAGKPRSRSQPDWITLI